MSLSQLHLIGWRMNNRGDVELVIALIAKNYSLIPEELFSALVIMAVITTFISPLVTQWKIESDPKIVD